MSKILILSLVFLQISFVAYAGEGMTVTGAKDVEIVNDCQVTARLAVQLMKMKAKTLPEKLPEIGLKILKDGGYKGSFGEADFIARFYAGMALQSEADVDEFMAKATKDDLDRMVEEHEVMCLEDALKDPVE